MDSTTENNSSAPVDDTTPNKSTVQNKLVESLNGDLLAVDFIWSLFMAALNSYRHDTVLKPFPSMFLEDGDRDRKDIKTLEEVAAQLPKMSEVLKKITDVEEKLLDLLWWTLDKRQFTVRALNKTDYVKIQKLTGHSVDAPVPNFLFEINYSETAENKFQDFRQGRQLLYAYHGSRIENFHSIIHHGLASHMNKTSLYGEGTYLSSELSVSLHYSPGGFGWDHSQLGDRLSCVAVCEMIDDSSVKCQLKRDQTDGNRTSNRTMAPSSMGGEVPEKYYVVTNNDMLRVKYLLVYGEKTSSKRALKEASWFSRHKFIVLLLVYVFVLAFVGLSNSKSFQYQIKRLLKLK